MKSGVRAGCNMMNLDRLPQYDPQDDIRMKRLNVDTTTCNDQVSVWALEDFLNDPQKNFFEQPTKEACTAVNVLKL